MTAPFTARALIPAHPDLAKAAGVSAQLANERYVEALARIVYYWGYPAVDTFGRTSSWDLMTEPGATLGLFPGAPKNRMGYLDDYMPPRQRKVVTPNNDTIYGVGRADLTDDAVAIQTPDEVPEGHYWRSRSSTSSPEGQFALIVRTYVPTQPLFSNTYKLPNVQRARPPAWEE